MKKLAVAALVLLGACTPPAPKPTPEPSPSPTATPFPVPECQVKEDQWWLGLPDSPTQMRPKVLAAMEALGEQCGKAPEETLDLLAAKLRSWGECAGRMTDSIFVQRHDDSGGFEEFGIFEEFHPVFYGNGCWTASPLKGVWRKLKPKA